MSGSNKVAPLPLPPHVVVSPAEGVKGAAQLARTPDAAASAAGARQPGPGAPSPAAPAAGGGAAPTTLPPQQQQQQPPAAQQQQPQQQQPPPAPPPSSQLLPPLQPSPSYPLQPLPSTSQLPPLRPSPSQRPQQQQQPPPQPPPQQQPPSAPQPPKPPQPPQPPQSDSSQLPQPRASAPPQPQPQPRQSDSSQPRASAPPQPQRQLQPQALPQPQAEQLQLAHGLEGQGASLKGPSTMQEMVEDATEFIPFGCVDLRESLLEGDDFKQQFKLDDNKKRGFRKLTRWLELRNSMALACTFDDVYDTYACIDPDNDMRETIEARAETETEKQMEHFCERLGEVLGRANFKELDQGIVNGSYGSQGFMGTGMAVKPVDLDVMVYWAFYRGVEAKTVQFRTWRTLFRLKTQEQIQFDRLAIIYRRRPQSVIDANNSKDSVVRRVWEWMFNFMFNPKELSCSSDMRPGRLYLKFFKDVVHSDIDVMLPGAEAQFSWMDYTIIFGSMAFAIGAAVYKALTGTIRFDSMMNILSTLVLILMPLYGAYKGYVAIKDKMQDLQFYVNRLFVTHNLSCNASVIATLLDEAQEQEDKEAMLAYFFLWRGLAEPIALTKEELDRSTEEYLCKLALREKLSITKINFEVEDGIGKLSRLGILKTEGQEPLQYKVLPLDQALQEAHIRQFDEEREVQQLVRMRKMGGLSDRQLWHECVGTYPATGQQFRYFWNVKTGQSTYEPPEQYTPLDTASNSASGLLAPPPAPQAGPRDKQQ